MSNHTYKILDDFTVEMWVPDQPQSEPPVLRQPSNPETGLPFASYEEAEAWITDFIFKREQPVVAVEETPVVE